MRMSIQNRSQTSHELGNHPLTEARWQSTWSPPKRIRRCLALLEISPCLFLAKSCALLISPHMCDQADVVMTCQTALVLAEADLPSRLDRWARETIAAGPQNGPTPTPDTPVSPRDPGLPWESGQECVHLLLSTMARLTWALACRAALGDAMSRLTAAQRLAWSSGKAQVTPPPPQLLSTLAYLMGHCMPSRPWRGHEPAYCCPAPSLDI